MIGSKMTAGAVLTKMIYWYLPIFVFLSWTNIYGSTAYTGMRNITSMELVADMGAGWNIGNSLDSYAADETGWGNPVTTKPMIDLIAYQGFKTLRLPVTWEFHMGPAPNYTIDPVWMDRVEEVANYAFDNDMYVIINIHHDEWIVPTYAELNVVKDRLTKVWTQIANRFKNYGDYLIFDTINEPRLKGSPEEWSGGTAEGRDVLNQYHKACVDAIRATGGNNATMHLMISTYAASSTDNAMNDFVLPNNDNRAIVSIHTYFPYQFCLEGSDATWGTKRDKNSLDYELDRVYNKFVANGIPVVLGEWGSTHNNNLSDRLAHADHYVKGSIARGMCPVLWDNGNVAEFGIMDRNDVSWVFQEIANTTINAAYGENTTYHLTVVNGSADGDYLLGESVNLVANSAPAGMIFSKWIGQTQGIADIFNPNTTLTMGGKDIQVEALYVSNTTYSLTVNNGSGDGDYIESAIVNVTADPPLADKVFSQWSGAIAYIDNINSSTTSVTMPAQNISITANYSPATCFAISSRIEAENYKNMFGIQTEPCSEGGENVGYIDVDDWMDYCIDVASEGTYKLDLRVAAVDATGQVQVQINGTTESTVNIPATGDWQSWTTISSGTFNLGVGKHTLRLYATGPLFNINWIEVVGSNPGNDTEAPSAPTQLSKTGSSTTTIDISWNASTDNVGVIGYNMFLDGVSVGSTAGTSYQFTGLERNTSYTLGVSAYDEAGNESAISTITTRTRANGARLGESALTVESAAPVIVYPNPVNESLKIQMPEELGSGVLSIYDSYGRKVFAQSNLIGIVNVDMSQFETGIYVLKVTLNSETSTHKVYKK
ncbi:MAG: cellulase family glycosylhydrolase [Marinoscillum sp.]|uniref:cellulase family glycosylhydrolase n=1 Tax=Marinoscillum sp. TaxID=2024838 RepID=UPI0032FEF0B6